jgi:hypothetical protein
VQPTADYGFILAGSSLSVKSGNKTSAANGDLDYWIWKMDEDGAEQWQKSFGGTGSDLLMSLRTTSDGGFILGGISNSPVSEGLSNGKTEPCRGGNDYWVIKLNARGAEQWQKTLGGVGQDDLLSVAQARDGGYIVGGSSASDANGDKIDKSHGNMDYWIIKLDGDGNEQWQKSFGGQYADLLRALEPTTDGGYILGGYSNSPQSTDKASANYGTGGDYWILKLDDKGDIQWQQTLGGDKDDQLYALHQTHDGGFIAGGNSNSGATGNKSRANREGTDFWVVRLDADGAITWQQTYNFGKVDILASLVEDQDHSFLIGGYAQGEGGKDTEGINDYIALKISETGETLWEKTVGSDGEDILKKAIETRDGGYLMAGTSDPETKAKSQNSKAKNGIDTSDTIGGAKKAQQQIDDTVSGATKEANGLYNEQASAVTDQMKKISGSDSPVKIGEPGNLLNTDKAAGSNMLAGQGPKPGLRASREKKTNFGNKDFWVVKLKDKDKKEKPKKSIEAFPNPTREYTNVIVGFDYDRGTASVYDLAGRQLQSFAVTDSTIPVDLGSYPEGIYVIRITTNKGEGSIKIIKGITKN